MKRTFKPYGQLEFEKMDKAIAILQYITGALMAVVIGLILIMLSNP